MTGLGTLVKLLYILSELSKKPIESDLFCNSSISSRIALILSGFISTAAFNRFELFPADGVEFYVARFETSIQSSIYKTDSAARELSDLIQKKLDPSNFESLLPERAFNKSMYLTLK